MLPEEVAEKHHVGFVSGRALVTYRHTWRQLPMEKTERNYFFQPYSNYTLSRLYLQQINWVSVTPGAALLELVVLNTLLDF